MMQKLGANSNIDSPMASMKRKFAINLEMNPRALRNQTSVTFQAFLKD